jgi:hypothetical protein
LQTRKEIFSDLSARFLEGLEKIMIGDETWVFQYNPEIKH